MSPLSRSGPSLSPPPPGPAPFFSSSSFSSLPPPPPRPSLPPTPSRPRPGVAAVAPQLLRRARRSLYVRGGGRGEGPRPQPPQSGAPRGALPAAAAAPPAQWRKGLPSPLPAAECARGGAATRGGPSRRWGAAGRGRGGPLLWQVSSPLTEMAAAGAGGAAPCGSGRGGGREGGRGEGGGTGERGGPGGAGGAAGAAPGPVPYPRCERLEGPSALCFKFQVRSRPLSPRRGFYRSLSSS